jgi:electron transport complex protein RnfA
MSITGLISIALGAILVENFILVKFLGICPFMGVSKKMDTALGMGLAVIFVMGVASMFCWLVNEFLLVPLNLEFMQTVAYILVIASLVQFVEMFLQKMVPSLYQALGIYLRLIRQTAPFLALPAQYTA